jgi:hypothetical protein
MSFFALMVSKRVSVSANTVTRYKLVARKVYVDLADLGWVGNIVLLKGKRK